MPFKLFVYLVGKKTHDFLKWVSEIIKIEADAVLKIKEFAIVNDCFQCKSNEEIGVFWRALFNKNRKKLMNPICHKKEF